MNTDLNDRIYDAAPRPSRPFDTDRARRKATRRKQFVAVSSVTLVSATFILLGVTFNTGEPEAPLVYDDWASRPTSPEEGPTADVPDACSSVPPLGSLSEAATFADEIVLFATCPTGAPQPDMHTGPYVGLGRGLDASSATLNDIISVYEQGLHPSEVDDGYILVHGNLPEESFSVTQVDDAVEISFTNEALDRNNITTSFMSSALIEEWSVQFLQLPSIERVQFTLEGSCEDFAAALERADSCVEVGR